VKSSRSNGNRLELTSCTSSPDEGGQQRVIRGPSEGHQRQSEGHQRVIRGSSEGHHRQSELHELAWELISVLLDEPRDEVAHRPSIVGDDEAVALLHGFKLGVATMLLRQLLKQLGIRRVRHEHLMREAIKHGISQSGELLMREAISSPSAAHPENY
jgi:hypothetical protein